MNKRSICALCALLLAASLFPAAADGVFPIARIIETSMETWRQDAGPGQRFDLRVRTFDERGLVTAMSITAGASETVSYRFFYEFDVRGNPKTITVTDAAEDARGRTVTHRLETVYDGDRVVSVTGPDIWGIPLPLLIGDFTGYADAEIRGGTMTFGNAGGRRVLERVPFGSDPFPYAETRREYEGGRPVRAVDAIVWSDREDRTERTFRPDGLPETVLEVRGEARCLFAFTYEPGTDGSGLPCLIGHPDPARCENAPESILAAYTILGRLGPDGRLASVRELNGDTGGRLIADGFGPRISDGRTSSVTVFLDSRGRECRREFTFDYASVQVIFDTEYEYRE